MLLSRLSDICPAIDGEHERQWMMLHAFCKPSIVCAPIPHGGVWAQYHSTPDWASQWHVLHVADASAGLRSALLLARTASPSESNGGNLVIAT